MVVEASPIPDLVVFVLVPSSAGGGGMCAGHSVTDGVSNVGASRKCIEIAAIDGHDAAGVGICDDVGGPAMVEVGGDSGAEVVFTWQRGHSSGKRCVGCGPWIGVGAVGSGVLRFVGGQCPGGSCTDVGGARVIGRSSSQEAPMSRVDACAARPVSAKEGDDSSESIAAGGLSVFPASSLPV